MIKRKFLFLFVLPFLMEAIFGQTTKDCFSCKLYGEWVFLNYYPGKLTDIRPLSKIPFNSGWGTPVMTYNQTGFYINDQGDYKTKGKFILDSTRRLIKEFDDNGAKGDTIIFEISYLDRDYLLITKQEATPITYFYRRN